MDAALQAAIDTATQEPDWQEGDEDAEYDDDEEYDAKAEEIAKRLGDQLWADIAKAQAEVGASATSNVTTTTTAEVIAAPADTASAPDVQPQPIDNDNASSQNRKQEAALVTVRTILSFAFKDPLVRATLASHTISALNSSVLDILTQCATSGAITKPVTKPLSEAVVSLAKSDVLFSSMRNSDAAAIQLDKGKRKRDTTEVDRAEQEQEGEEGGRYQKRVVMAPPPPPPPVVIEYPDVLHLQTQAVRAIMTAFASQPPSPWTNGAPSPSLISSIQYPLHQVYLFCVTSAPRARPEQVHLIHELAALIQMLGVLSKIPIGPPTIVPPPPPPPPHHHSHPHPWDTTTPGGSPTMDIGTAVYPCLVPGCTKTFHRLYSLRTHQRLHALVDRPYKCVSCPASFARNHDLKRHVKMHDKTAWKCLGCEKVFSRRDAIKRHKDSKGKGSGGGKGQQQQHNGDGVDHNNNKTSSSCANSGVEQVEVEKAEDEEEVTRRAKMWNGIVATQMANASVAAAEVQAASSEGSLVPIVVHVENENQHVSVEAGKVTEDGEIPQHVVEHAQATVLQLYPVIKGRLGPSEAALQSTSIPQTPAGQQPPGYGTGDSPHPTLASVIARTQPQYYQPPTQSEPPGTAAEQNSSDQSLPLSWLTEEQTRLLEQAIAQAASVAQAQAEAEAALEEEEEELMGENEVEEEREEAHFGGAS
ncbi:hypothetical protein BC835DRAFT_187222 [Cytidiella melzeri]|nr:hypothetical protein BC835DRAFT_187222 [Cytidiella melzeri]